MVIDVFFYCCLLHGCFLNRVLVGLFVGRLWVCVLFSRVPSTGHRFVHYVRLENQNNDASWGNHIKNMTLHNN